MPLYNQSSKEGRLSLAIQVYNLGLIKSIRQAAQSYDIPYATLSTRLYRVLP